MSLYEKFIFEQYYRFFVHLIVAPNLMHNSLIFTEAGMIRVLQILRNKKRS